MNPSPDIEGYHLTLAAAFVRGQLGETLPARLAETPLSQLDDPDCVELVRIGIEAGLRLTKFKRSRELPRVRAALGILHNLSPTALLDLGSGRGTFLWPCLEIFSDLPVTAGEISQQRLLDLQAVRAGGVERLSAAALDASDLDLPDNCFDVITLLEVLEHIPDTTAVIGELVRVAQRAVVLSAPSKPDQNPEHIHLFNESILRRHFARHGITKVNCSWVPGHILVVVNLGAQ